MQLYEAKIRLNGSVMSEVRKTDLTAAEIVVLKTLHGKDAVLEIKSLGREARDPVEGDDEATIPRASQQERDRLERIYSMALKNIAGVLTLNGIFGVGQPLPTVVEGVVLAVETKPVRTRVTRPGKEEVPAPEDELV